MVARTNLSPKATYVTRGYGQVEPNHLSARRTGQIYAQLPASKDITILENGQFAKYDYAKKVVDFKGPGEWMLVFNEVKVYKDREGDADFAMIKDDYEARVYNATGAVSISHWSLENDGKVTPEIDNSDGYGMMPEGTTMVPRLLKTNVGDIMTTNTIKATTLTLGEFLTVDTDGYLKSAGTTLPTNESMVWQVVRVWNMPDLQPGVKIQRVV